MSEARLRAVLEDCARVGRLVTYGALAAEIGLDGAGRIARLTDMLEALMVEDAGAGHPLRAALVLGRTSAGLPARGFFLKAAELGFDVSDPETFHRAQITALFSAAS
ncbi:MAG: hypothetical protein JJU07_15110 [Natronohydrobacter sp.]|nr:hypothetical protein [Natronohydrobacter sp.]